MGSSNGSNGAQRTISDVPKPALQRGSRRPILKRRMPEGVLELPAGTRSSHRQLQKALQMRKEQYTRRKQEVIRRAFVYARDLHKDETREGEVNGHREPYINHCVNIAMRAARLGMSTEAICAGLLHDSIENSKEGIVTPEEIVRLFKDFPVPSHFGKRVAEIVVLLTKPKFSENGEWVFPDSPEYYKMISHYTRELYDERSRVYYEKLLSTRGVGGMDFEAVALKLLDNLHNAETMRGLQPAKRQANLRTMLNNTMVCAKALLSGDDFQYVKSVFTRWGFPFPATLELRDPEDVIVIFRKRDEFTRESLARHPNTDFAFISVYGRIPEAFMDDYVEIGIPPGLDIPYERVLQRHLAGFGIERQKSRVPRTFASHEEIFRISGFNPIYPSGRRAHGQLILPGFTDILGRPEGWKPQPNRWIRHSTIVDGFIEVLDERGETAIGLSRDFFSEYGTYFTGNLGELFEEVIEKYNLFLACLYGIYEGELEPALLPLQSIMPAEPLLSMPGEKP